MWVAELHEERADERQRHLDEIEVSHTCLDEGVIPNLESRRGRVC